MKKIDTDFDLINLLQEKKGLSNFYFLKKKKIFKLQNLSKKIRDFVWKNYAKFVLLEFN